LVGVTNQHKHTMTKYWLNNGLIRKGPQVPTGGYSISRLLRWFFDQFGITYKDPDAISATTVAPVRYNNVTNTIEMFNGTAWALAVDSQQYNAAAINSSATATAAQVAGGLITSTSAAPTTVTLPTATALAALVGGVRGTEFEFIVDNSAGASTVTVAVNTGITIITAVVTGTATMTVAAGAVGLFRIVYSSATTAFVMRRG
jgi:hypothetical protein